MARREKLWRAFGRFEAAVVKLKTAVDPDFQAQFQKDILIEIITKRFEYTFESLWKCLQEILREEGIQATTPLACFQEAFHAGLIPESSEEIFPLMVRKRNEIVHIYSDENAEEVYTLIKHNFIQAMLAVLERVRTHLGPRD